MSRFRLVLITLGMVMVIMVWTAPATLMDGAVNQLSSGRLRMVSASGTLWAGNAQLEVRNREGAAVFASNIDWALNKSSLLLGTLSVSYHAFNQPLPGTVQLGISSVLFTDINFDLPAAALAGLLPAAQGYGLGGTLNLTSRSLNLTRSATLGSVLLRWLNASSSLAPVAPLGSYELQLVGNPAPLQFSGTLITLHGPLQLDGTGKFGTNQAAVLQVLAQLPESDYVELAPFMRLIAVESAGRQFVLEM